MVQPTEDFSKQSPSRWVAGFWRRPFAFLTDYLILGSIGMLLYDWLVSLGPLARAVGLAMVLAYFGVMNSKIGRGQTVGNRLLKIKVVSEDNESIGIRISLLWAGVLLFPLTLNGIALPPSQ
ncbi:MAG: hypothetical protein CNE99_07760 [OM182 bacterium MED-G24]|uniref:RDD domain-containing protein n=1 Tax=OM182 bacterium MED-G24 TaxID=1986255 RepID=A0A2A5WNJ6_9GAMM|nr:MAG: hypothetical protein CNE99_07760 [OM182 bacterium MED-G24]